MKKYILMAMSVAVMGLTSCSDNTMDTINKDNQHPEGGIVSAYLQLSEAIMSTGFSIVSGDYAFYTASLTEQVAGTGNNQLMKAELRQSGELAASSTFNNCWGSAYSNLMNLKQMEDKIKGGLASSGDQWDLLGAVQCLQALNWGILTDLHGDIPYAEALNSSEYLQPNLSKQEDVYKGILATLEEAIANLKKGENLKSMGNQDLLFGNNNKQWLGLAYALKARYNLHKSKVEGNAAIETAKQAAQEAVKLGFNGAEITEFNGVTCDNPWSAFIWSRGYSAPCATVADLMAANDDPRFDFYNGEAAVPAGDEEAAKVSFCYDYPFYYDLGSQPIHVFSAHEVWFILAECQARLNEPATEAFQTAVSLSVEEQAAWLGEPANGDAFAESLGTPDLQMIMEQKYIAMAVDEQVETYNDLRRCMAMGEEHITLNNPKNVQGGLNRWPNMLPYGNSSVSSNPNLSAAFGDGLYIYDKKTWINGGN